MLDTGCVCGAKLSSCVGQVVPDKSPLRRINRGLHISSSCPRSPSSAFWSKCIFGIICMTFGDKQIRNRIIAEAKIPPHPFFVLPKADDQRWERRKETYRSVDLNTGLTFPPYGSSSGLRPGVSYCQNIAQLLKKLALGKIQGKSIQPQ